MCSSDGSLIVYQKPFSAKCDRVESSGQPWNSTEPQEFTANSRAAYYQLLQFFSKR